MFEEVAELADAQFKEKLFDIDKITPEVNKIISNINKEFRDFESRHIDYGPSNFLVVINLIKKAQNIEVKMSEGRSLSVSLITQLIKHSYNIHASIKDHRGTILLIISDTARSRGKNKINFKSAELHAEKVKKGDCISIGCGDFATVIEKSFSTDVYDFWTIHDGQGFSLIRTWRINGR